MAPSDPSRAKGGKQSGESVPVVAGVAFEHGNEAWKQQPRREVSRDFRGQNQALAKLLAGWRLINHVECVPTAMNETRAESVLRLPQVLAITGLSKSSVYNKLAPGRFHDPTFPKRKRLGRRAVGWIAREVFAWVAARPHA